MNEEFFYQLRYEFPFSANGVGQAIAGAVVPRQRLLPNCRKSFRVNYAEAYFYNAIANCKLNKMEAAPKKRAQGGMRGPARSFSAGASLAG
jgi:hypothetical protein